MTANDKKEEEPAQPDAVANQPFIIGETQAAKALAEQNSQIAIEYDQITEFLKTRLDLLRQARIRE